MDYGAVLGFIMIFASAGYYDTQLLEGVKVTFATFVPAIFGAFLLVLWLNGKAVRRFLRRMMLELIRTLEEGQRSPKPEYRKV